MELSVYSYFWCIKNAVFFILKFVSITQTYFSPYSFTLQSLRDIYTWKYNLLSITYPVTLLLNSVLADIQSIALPLLELYQNFSSEKWKHPN